MPDALSIAAFVQAFGTWTVTPVTPLNASAHMEASVMLALMVTVPLRLVQPPKQPNMSVTPAGMTGAVVRLVQSSE